MGDRVDIKFEMSYVGAPQAPRTDKPNHCRQGVISVSWEQYPPTPLGKGYRDFDKYRKVGYNIKNAVARKKTEKLKINPIFSF